VAPAPPAGEFGQDPVLHEIPDAAHGVRQRLREHEMSVDAPNLQRLNENRTPM
jgi:hypothetical protein